MKMWRRTGPFGVAADSSGVYVANPYNDPPDDPPQVKKVPLAGGSVTSLATSPSGTGPYYLALDDSYIYWTAHATATGAIMKTAKDGSSSTPIASNQDRPYAIAIDSTTAYWTNLSGTVMKVSLSGGTPTLLATGQPTPTGIAVNGSSVYWVNANNGTGTPGSVMRLTPK
jgi:hypothetical protein